jgi:predicted RNA-binding protein YlqC (UPF0109 family)
MIASGTIMKTTVEKPKQKGTPTADLLRDLVRAFTKYSDDVNVTTYPGEGRAKDRETLTLRVNADDAPLVQGKWGRVLQALRTIFTTIGARESRNITLIWSEPTVGKWKETIEEYLRPYKPDDVKALAERLLARLFVEPTEVAIYDGDPAGDKVPVVLEFKVPASDIEIANALSPFLGLIFSAIGKRSGKDLHLQMTPVINVPTR